MVYIIYMYVNKRVELSHRGIALKKMYVLLLKAMCSNLEKSHTQAVQSLLLLYTDGRPP